MAVACTAGGCSLFNKTRWQQEVSIGVLPQDTREFFLGLTVSDEWLISLAITYTSKDHETSVV